MTVNTNELTMSELMKYVGHLERVLTYYNPTEVKAMTTTHFKEVCAKKGA